MSRKEEILGYCGESNYKPFSIEACVAIKAIEWADKNPRKGFWDSEKVIKWLQDNADSYIWYDETENECGITDNFIKDLQKAMED